MHISIFGLGYVGTIMSACLSKNGHIVIGVDINPEKVSIINQGRSPIIEKGIEDLILEAVKRKKLIATTDTKYAIKNTEVSIICIGTPANGNGSQDISSIKRVSKEIGRILRFIKTYHLIVIRSTLLPGTTERFIIPILERNSGKKAGRDFGVAVNPEFLREGDSLEDFYNPSRTIIGSKDKKSGDLLERLYQEFVNSPAVKTDLKTAEMVKYIDNAFHGLKISFANEIGNICQRLNINVKEVLKIFYMDKKLNISSAYLKSGFAFGGSCLIKDLTALIHLSTKKDINLPLLEGTLMSNELQLKKGIELILKLKKKKIALLGLSFKPGTDDLRESPFVKLSEALIGKGLSLKIYDRNVSLAKLFGANKRYIQKEIPHISENLCKTLKDALDSSEVLVVAHNIPEFRRLPKLMNKRQILIDLVGLDSAKNILGKRYYGLCW